MAIWIEERSIFQQVYHQFGFSITNDPGPAVGRSPSFYRCTIFWTTMCKEMVGSKSHDSHLRTVRTERSRANAHVYVTQMSEELSIECMWHPVRASLKAQQAFLPVGWGHVLRGSVSQAIPCAYSSTRRCGETPSTGWSWRELLGEIAQHMWLHKHSPPLVPHLFRCSRNRWRKIYVVLGKALCFHSTKQIFHGSVLVVKQRVVDMTTTDHLLANFLISSALHYHTIT